MLTIRSLAPELAELDRQFAALKAEASVLVNGLKESQFNWRPGADSWSMAGCLLHLNIVGDRYVHVLEKTLAEARARGWGGEGPFGYGWLGEWILANTEFLVDIETMPDGLLTVIVTLEKLTAAVVARIDVRGRIEQRVPDPAASTAGPPAGQPPHHLIVIHNEFQDHVEPGLPGREQLLERLSLRHGPGEAVQQEPGLGVVVLEPVGDHGDGPLVRNQVPSRHVRLGPAAERGAMADVVAEDITCRDLRDRQVRRYELGPQIGRAAGR